MKFNTILILLLATCSLLFAKQTSKKGTVKSVNKKTSSTATKTAPTIVNTSGNNNTNVINNVKQNKSNTLPKQDMPEAKMCNACGIKDGKIIELEGNTLLKYDSVCTSYTNAIDLTKLSGIWKYEKTYIFSNNHYFVEKIRNFFDNVPDERKILSADSLIEKSSDEMIDERIKAKKWEADILGRDVAYTEDMMIPFDPKVSYQFINNAGDNTDYFIISRVTSKNIIQYLTQGEIKFTGYTLATFNKSYLELYYQGTKTVKKFRILSLNNFSMILADDRYSEIHYFKR